MEFASSLFFSPLSGALSEQSLTKKLLAHYAEHPPCLDNADSILDMIFWNYTESNPIEDDQSKRKYTAIRERISSLSTTDYDATFNLICDLCTDHERLAFREGIRFGMLLMRELEDG